MRIAAAIGTDGDAFSASNTPIRAGRGSGSSVTVIWHILYSILRATSRSRYPDDKQGVYFARCAAFAMVLVSLVIKQGKCNIRAI
jgi:hypothetical protein